MRKGTGFALGTLVALLTAAAPASASTYCVPTGGGPGCTNAGALTLQQALTNAATISGPDTVRVAAGTFQPVDCSTNGFTYNSPDPLTLTGAGAQTVLTCPANYNNVTTKPILGLSGPVTVSNLLVNIPSGFFGWGVSFVGGVAASDLTVTSDPAGQGVTGVRMTGGSLQHSLIGTPLADNGTTVLAANGAALSDVSVNGGGTGINAEGNPDTTVVHSKVAARRGILTDSFGVTVSDTTIDVLPGSGFGTAGGLLTNNTSGPNQLSITARHVSIAGTAPGSLGVDVEALVAGQTASATITDTVIHGPTTALKRSAVAGSTSNLTTSYSAYAAGNYAGTGAGATTETTPPITADPGFNAPADPHIDAGSPLIDAGTPGGLGAGEPTTDLDGNPRILDGNGDCAARRDIGAYEFAGSDTVHASAPARGVVRRSIAFHATGCSIQSGLPVTFTWSFDDGGTGAGANVTHAFARAGVHHATVTIHDSAGRTGSASIAVTVALPTISHLKLSPARVRVRPRKHKHDKLGTTISYADTVAGRTTFTVLRPAPGVRHGKTCGPVPRHPGKHVKRCTRFVVVGTFSHVDVAGANRLRFNGKLRGRALAPGSYRLTAVPAGGSGKPATVAFTVIG